MFTNLVTSLNFLGKWFITNLSIIRDTLWIILTLLATVIAVLTYHRARYTLLQPYKSEVIKRQTDVFIQLLEMFKPSAYFHFYKDVSMDTIDCNIFSIFADYGIDFEDSDDEMKNLLGGYIGQTEGAFECYDEVYFDADETALEEKNKKKTIERIDQLMTGQLEFDCFYLSKSYLKILNEIHDKINNPILPKELQQKLIRIKDEFVFNITEVLRDVIFENMRIILLDFAATNKLKNISQYAIHNQFNHHPKKIDQSSTINDFIGGIREFLKIDYI